MTSGLLIGFAVGLCVGLWIGATLHHRSIRTLRESYEELHGLKPLSGKDRTS